MTQRILDLISLLETKLKLFDRIRLGALPLGNGISAEIITAESSGDFLDGGRVVREEIQLLAKHSSQTAAMQALDSVAELIAGGVTPRGAVRCSSSMPIFVDSANGCYIYSILIKTDYYIERSNIND